MQKWMPILLDLIQYQHDHGVKPDSDLLPDQQ